MDTIQAFAMGDAHRHAPMRVFDWDKAAEMIKKLRPSVAAAGLQGDWEWTGGEIYRMAKIGCKNS